MNIHSWKMLHDPEVGGKLDPSGLRKLMLAAGYGEEAAQQAATRRAEQRLDDGLPMFQTRYVSQ